MKNILVIVISVAAFFAVGMLDPEVAAHIQERLLQIVYF